MIKKLLIASAIFTTFTTKTVAAEQFSTSYDVTYDIDSIGQTKINQKIGITNKQDDVIATQYELKIKEINISNVSAKDPEGKLDVDINTDGTITTLNTAFNEQVIGEGRTLNWELNYTSDDIAKKVGSIWNIHIPKVETLESTENYRIKLKVPQSFGPKIFISPTPVKTGKDGNKDIYEFNKESLSEEGVTASFGTYQTLNFELLYKLKNDSSLASYQEIALPPNIKNKQQVFYNKIKPTPQEINSDEDGNYLAKYKVPPNDILEISLSGTVKITGNQITPKLGAPMSKLPNNLVRKYTGTKEYWEVNSPQIQQVATQLFDPKITVSENAQKAYNYVVQEFDYDFNISEKTFVDRAGAQKAIINEGPWACMEFTDTFIALTRAMGIPARELNGYAFTQQDDSISNPLSISFEGGDLLHAWAEYYDPEFGWVQVDPTWGNTSKIDYFTKLDTNHFTFVRKGVDPTYPYPAGAYKITGNEKQIQVSVVENAESNTFQPNIDFYEVLTLNPWMVIKGKQKYILHNNGDQGTVTIYNVNNTGEDLLPFQTKKFFLDNEEEEITYEDFNNVEQTLKITSKAGEPKKAENNTAIYLGVLLGLLLCVMIYLLVIFPKVRKKLLRPLQNLPRGLGR